MDHISVFLLNDCHYFDILENSIYVQGGDGFFNEVLNGYLLSRLKVPLPPSPSDSFDAVQSRGSSSVPESGDAVHESDQKEHFPLLHDSVQEVMNFSMYLNQLCLIFFFSKLVVKLLTSCYLLVLLLSLQGQSMAHVKVSEFYSLQDIQLAKYLLRFLFYPLIFYLSCSFS